MARRPPDLARVVDALSKVHGRPAAPIPRTPMAFVLWENVAYLVDDERRAAIFRALEKRTALDPARIARLSDEAIEAIVEKGGMRPADRARKVRACAEIALELGGGDLRQILELPEKRARRALKRFPGIGDPGADWILLACGAANRIALDSNALRVLLRLGYGSEKGAYAAQYKSVVGELEGCLGGKPAALVRARETLRAHGRAICKNNAPDCDACPLVDSCAFASGGSPS